jgi:hypothetical protein
MATLDKVLQQLRQEHKQAEGEVQKLEKAILAIESLTGNGMGVTAKRTRPKRTMSAAARRKIAKAQRARWAKTRKQSEPAKSQGAASARRGLSPEGRKRIAAAARARWARLRSQQKKKAA